MKKLKWNQISLSSWMYYIVLAALLCGATNYFIGQSHQETYKLNLFHSQEDFYGKMNYLLVIKDGKGFEINGKKVKIRNELGIENSKLGKLQVKKDVPGGEDQWVVMKYRKYIIPELRSYDMEIHTNLD